jgi:hypothetical protein
MHVILSLLDHYFHWSIKSVHIYVGRIRNGMRQEDFYPQGLCEAFMLHDIRNEEACSKSSTSQSNVWITWFRRKERDEFTQWRGSWCLIVEWQREQRVRASTSTGRVRNNVDTYGGKRAADEVRDVRVSNIQQCGCRASGKSDVVFNSLSCSNCCHLVVWMLRFNHNDFGPVNLL